MRYDLTAAEQIVATDPSQLRSCLTALLRAAELGVLLLRASLRKRAA